MSDDPTTQMARPRPGPATGRAGPRRGATSRRRRPRRRGWLALPRNVRLTVTVCAFLFLLSGVSLAVMRVTRSGALPGTLVAGVDVGGLDEQALRDRIARMAAARSDDRIVMVRPATSTQGEASVTATKGELGYELDVDATVDQVLERGRQSNPIAALADHLAAFVSDRSMEPVEVIANGQLTARVETLAADVVAAPQEGDLIFKGTAITRVDPAPGAQVDFSRLLGPIRGVLLAPGA